MCLAALRHFSVETFWFSCSGAARRKNLRSVRQWILVARREEDARAVELDHHCKVEHVESCDKEESAKPMQPKREGAHR